MDRERERLRTYQRKRWAEMLKSSKRAPPPEGIELESECLIWTGHQTTNKYGSIGYRGKQKRTHRISYEIAHDLEDIPSHNERGEKLEVRHLCNVPLCMEPTHLALGTPSENGQDKARNPNAATKGSGHYNTSMTEELATQIKHSRTTGEYQTQPERAKEFNVPLSVVRDIDAGTTWAHIPNSDGVVDTSKSEAMRAKKKARRDFLKTKPWTKEEWTSAEEKLNNPEYTRRHPTRSYSGIPCLEWIKYTEGGYGRMSINGQRLKAHIVACTIGNNYIRPVGLEAAHKCGFSQCVEKTHLHFVNGSTNSLDKHIHGTMPTKLSEKDVREIRNMYDNGEKSIREISEHFDSSPGNLHSVIHGKTWSHVEHNPEKKRVLPAKLTDTQRLEIREKAKETSYSILADEYNISKSQVSRIVNKK